GTGFDDRTLRTLHTRLKSLERDSSPFSAGEVKPPKGARFVRPELVAEAAFTEGTGDRQLRPPTLHALRQHRGAAEVVRERPVAPPRRNAESTVAGVRLTHPDRVFWPEVGVTKLD